MGFAVDGLGLQSLGFRVVRDSGLRVLSTLYGHAYTILWFYFATLSDCVALVYMVLWILHRFNWN